MGNVVVAQTFRERLRWKELLDDAPCVVLSGGVAIQSFTTRQDFLVLDCDANFVICRTTMVSSRRLHVHSPFLRWTVIAPIELGRRWTVVVGDQLEISNELSAT